MSCLFPPVLQEELEIRPAICSRLHVETLEQGRYLSVLSAPMMNFTAEKTSNVPSWWLRNVNSVPTASVHPNSALQQLEAGYAGEDKSSCQI